MSMRFQMFSSGGMFTTPAAAIKGASEEAASFASRLHPEQVVSVTQSMPQPNLAHVTVWYWDHRPSSQHVSSEQVMEGSASDEQVEQWLDSSE